MEINTSADNHRHDYDIHYTSTDFQTPIFIKCLECGSTFYLARKERLEAAERLADAVEDILFFIPDEDKERREMHDAWQAYADTD